MPTYSSLGPVTLSVTEQNMTEQHLDSIRTITILNAKLALDQAREVANEVYAFTVNMAWASYYASRLEAGLAER